MISFSSPSANALSDSRTPLSTLLSRPLIAGASVSADQGALSPGKRLALLHTEAESVRTIAIGGRPGVEMAARLTDSVLKDRTVLIGVDLFFWDSTLPSADRSIAALQSLMGRAKKLGLPVVLGEIPALLPQMQPQRARLNQAIREACREHGRCGIMPFESIHQEAMRTGYLQIGGRRVALRELIPDGLHLSETASLYLMERLTEVIPR